MITIDIIDDNVERSAKTVVQAYPTVNNWRNGSIDPAYASARNFHEELLEMAKRERQMKCLGDKLSNESREGNDVMNAIYRIARALSDWL